MKSYAIIIIFLFASAHLAAEESPDSLYSMANKAYSSGSYEQAFATYRQILDMGYDSPELYYNLGNASFRSNKLGYAILYYEKALKEAPGFEEAAKNLEYVSMYKEDHLESVPEFFLGKWTRFLLDLFPVKVWSIIAIGCFVILLAGILVYIYAGDLRMKKTGFFAGILAMLIFAVSLTASLRQHRELTHPDKAIIISPSVVVKSTPSDTGNDLFVLHEGTKIETDEVVGDWTEIKISDGRIGWVSSNTFALI